MLKGRSSLTALAVASARALASMAGGAVFDPRDALAARLLPKPLAFAAHAVRAVSAHSALPAVLASRASAGFVNHIALRSGIIDHVLKATEAGAGGLAQLVILGAGLDTRAHRLDALRATTVYEVDHPDGQRLKRERAHAIEVRASALRYVPVDLARDDLLASLTAAGFARDQPSFWLAEGLVPYLSRATVDHTLQQIGSVARPGSQLLITYVTPELSMLRHAPQVVLSALRLIGEPLQTVLTPADVAALLRGAGFDVTQDSDTHDWARVLSPENVQAAARVQYERLALGQVR
jgi:methyltransferase (TIGR00027 family)